MAYPGLPQIRPIPHSSRQYFQCPDGLFQQNQQNLECVLGIPGIQEFHRRFLDLAQLIRQPVHMPIRFRHPHTIQTVDNSENMAAMDLDVHFFLRF